MVSPRLLTAPLTSGWKVRRRSARWKPPSPESFPSVFTYMRDINFAPNGRVGFIVGQKGRILRTTDSGFQWSQVLPHPNGARG